MRLLGLIPLGWQAIVIELPALNGETRTLVDNGYSPMLPQWNHRITVEPHGDGCRYTDEVTFEARPATWLAAPVIRMFFRHRQRRLRALAKAEFSGL